MFFGITDASPESIVLQYGLAGVCMLAEAGVIIYLSKKSDKLQTNKDAIQEQRIIDARETRDKVMEPLEKQAIMGEKTYELLLNLTNRKGQ